MKVIRSRDGKYKQPGAAAGRKKDYYAKHLDELDKLDKHLRQQALNKKR